MMDNSIYINPLSTRYASKEMQHAFSDDKRFKLWRKLWVALAESQMELGLNVSQEQVDELKAYAEEIDFELASKFEEIASMGKSEICFIIGSSFGLSDSIKQRADYKLSISKLTFPHQLLRVILYETTYRSLSIVNGTKYHK